MTKPRALVIAATIALTAAAGCKVGPDYQPPKENVPAAFAAAPQNAPPADIERWWESFHDATLSRLISQAVQANLDVRLAEARVREARAQLEGDRATLYPTLDADASYVHTRLSANLPGFPPGFPYPRTYDTFIGQFDAAWEVDVFGGTRRTIESARDTFQSQIEARRNALVTLLSEVALNYMILRGQQQELAVVERNVAAQEATLDLTRTKLQAGLATDVDVAQAETQVEASRARIPTLRTGAEQAIHHLSVLLDLPPAALEPELAPPGPLPAGPPAIPPGLPSDLLRRRPDVRQAERLVAAATANIGVATADLFPKFSLTGTDGLESATLGTFARRDSNFWTVGPSVTWRIFDAGQIRANIRAQNARQEEALIQYRQAALQALVDVEDALVAYGGDQVRRKTLYASVQSARRAAELSLGLYKAGVVDFLTVLITQQALYQTEDQLAQSEQAVSTDLIALYKALGGGWETTESGREAKSR
ncbi:MAG: efflux transporter outer membrane subunit [Candidatus Brocadiia bacterium]